MAADRSNCALLGASQAETMQNNFLGELSDRIATAAKAKY